VRASFNTQVRESWLDDRSWCGDLPSICGDGSAQKTQIIGFNDAHTADHSLCQAVVPGSATRHHRGVDLGLAALVLGTRKPRGPSPLPGPRRWQRRLAGKAPWLAGQLLLAVRRPRERWS
jgi:hypothetical protein